MVNNIRISSKLYGLVFIMSFGITRTAKLVEEISTSSTEQNPGARQINSAIQQLNNVTQQNPANSEEMAASAEELSIQADQLKEIISFFKFENIKPYASKVYSSGITMQTAGITKKIKPAVCTNKADRIHLNMDALDEEYEKF